MSRTNEARRIKWLETCKCKCRLDASVCNNKQRWNNDECRCECKELIDKGIFDKGFVMLEIICDKSRDVREYLDYESCKCRKRLTDKLVEECSENIDGNKMIYNGTLSDYHNVCNSCTIYIVIAFLIIIGISSAFIHFHWYLEKSSTNITNINPGIETVIY